MPQQPHAPEPPRPADALPHTAELHLPDRVVRVKVPPGGFLWDAAAASGVTLPHVCLQGWCLTCAARLVAGRVDMSAARRYYPADEAAGFILPCTAVPVTDVVVVTHQRDAMIQHRRQHRLPAPSGGKPR